MKARHDFDDVSFYCRTHNSYACAGEVDREVNSNALSVWWKVNLGLFALAFLVGISGAWAGDYMANAIGTAAAIFVGALVSCAALGFTQDRLKKGGDSHATWF